MDRPSDRKPALRLGGVLEFMRLLWALNHKLESHSKRMNASFGVTGPQRLVLRIIGRMPLITAGELAATLHMHPSTLTGIVQRLTERELIERLSDPRDGRRALFTLTPAGRAIDKLRAGTVEAAIRKALRDVPPERRSAAEDVLESIIGVLDQDGAGTT